MPTGETEGPQCTIDGIEYSLKALQHRVHGDAAYVFKSKQQDLAKIADLINVVDLRFKDMQMADLSALSRMSKLRSLQIYWNTKLTDLDSLRALPALEILSLGSTTKIRSLTPLQDLQSLKVLEIRAGVWGYHHLDTLEPLGQIKGLQELYLNTIRVREGGLKPISLCVGLRYLGLPYRFPLEQYAYLAAKMPGVNCDEFKPFAAFRQPQIYSCICRGVGILDPAKDQEKIAAIETRFAAAVEKFKNGADLVVK
ncbi:MAG: leucine-rich repeat domain-containing protein [Armatimonadota bacterium]